MASSSPSSISVFVIIINYNTPQLTIDCLHSLEKLHLPRHVTCTPIVIDNASRDDSVSLIQAAFPKLNLHINQQNTGFTGGNNQGVELAREQGADFVMLLNSDTLVDPELLRHLLDSSVRHPQGMIFAPKIYFAPGKEFHQQRYTKSEQGKVIWFAGGHMDWANVYGSHVGVDEVDSGQYDQEQRINLASGCCLLIRKHVFQHQALFDDRYFMYYEDAELCARVLQQSHEIWYVPQAKLWHINAGSSGAGSDLQDYFITRNRLLLGFSYAPFRTRFALMRESLRLLINGRQWQKIAVRDYYLNRLNKGSCIK